MKRTESAELTFLPCYSRIHWTIWKRWWNSMMPFPRSPIVPGNRPISRGIIAKIFQIDSSWEKNSGVTDKGGKSFPWNALSPSSCRSLRARGWRRARDPVRRLAKPTLPHLPRLPPFQRLISTDFHNGSMYEYVRSILAPGYFPLTYRPS